MKTIYGSTVKLLKADKDGTLHVQRLSDGKELVGGSGYVRCENDQELQAIHVALQQAGWNGENQ